MTGAGRLRPSSMRWTDWGILWNGRCLTAKILGSPNPEKVYLIGYLDKRCRGKIFPFTETAGTPLIQIRPGAQGERVYSPEGVSCTLTAQPGGFGGKTGLYEVGLPIKENTKKGYAMAYPGDSIDLAYSTTNTRRGRLGERSPIPLPPAAAKVPWKPVPLGTLW